MKFKFNSGDVIVREDTYKHGGLVEGSIAIVEKNVAVNCIKLLDKERGLDFSPEKFRLATEEEIQAYNNGIRNIKDIKKTSKILEHLVSN